MLQETKIYVNFKCKVSREWAPNNMLIGLQTVLKNI